jgi:hypothetical protein
MFEAQRSGASVTGVFSHEQPVADPAMGPG